MTMFTNNFPFTFPHGNDCISGIYNERLSDHCSLKKLSHGGLTSLVEKQRAVFEWISVEEIPIILVNGFGYIIEPIHEYSVSVSQDYRKLSVFYSDTIEPTTFALGYSMIGQSTSRASTADQMNHWGLRKHTVASAQNFHRGFIVLIIGKTVIVFLSMNCDRLTNKFICGFNLIGSNSLSGAGIASLSPEMIVSQLRKIAMLATSYGDMRFCIDVYRLTIVIFVSMNTFGFSNEILRGVFG